LLGLHPGPDFTALSAATLADTRPEQAKALLESLLDEHLLDQTTCGRYRFHDLVHSYARERADDEEPADGGIDAVRRLLVWYQHTAEAAGRALAPDVRRFPVDPAGVPGRYLVRFGSCGQALAWCDAEHANLAAAVRAASRHRFDVVAWRLALALHGFFRLRKRWDEWIATFTVAVCAARRLEDAIGEATLLDGLATAYCEAGRFPESLDCLRRALSLYRGSGDRVGESQVLNHLGDYHRHRGRFEEAADHYRRSTDICRELGIDDAIGVNNLGKAHRAAGRNQEGLDCHLEALTSVGDGDHYVRAEILNDLGEAYSGLGQFDRAVEFYRLTLTLRRSSGDRHGEAETLHGLGQTFRSSGRDPDAVDCFRRAADIRRELDDTGASADTVERLGQN
jgi:tetratricopeptide (TPR) repeat protein